MKFEDFKLNEHLMEALSYMGFDEATPIQEQAIPKILEGKDMIASAQTGTGKTAAFLLPILHKLTDKHDQLNTLIIDVSELDFVNNENDYRIILKQILDFK